MTSPRILYVEDDDDIRSVVTQVLQSEGFEVAGVSSAEDALGELSVATFDLLLTDYRLPLENAAWLLREATARGFLSGTPVVVLSAETRPPGIEGHTLLTKPVDLDVLSAAIANALSDRVASARRGSRPPAEAPQVVLTLYVTARSRTSQKAVRNLERILATFDAARIHLRVCDVAQPPVDAAEVPSMDDDRIVVTPTLVVRAAGRRVWIAGDLSDTVMVEQAIREGLGSIVGDVS